MQRMTPGPFGGRFDRMLEEIDYESPMFIPWLILTLLLVFVFLATVWALWRRPRLNKHEPRGFDVVVKDEAQRPNGE